MNPKGKTHTLIVLGAILLFGAVSEADENDLAWSTFLGGGNPDYAYGIALDGSGNTYLTGQTTSSDFPTTSGAFDTTWNDDDAFVAKVNAAGNGLFYATFLGGSSSDDGKDIALDESGNAYVVGITWSDDFPITSEAFDTTHNGTLDLFVAKLSPAGDTLDYATYLGGTFLDFGYGIAVDDSNCAHAIGRTGSDDFPTTATAFDTSYNSNEDAFVAKLSPAGDALRYATFLGGSDPDYGYGIAMGDHRCAYVTGETNSADFPTTWGAFDTTQNGGSDAFVAKLSPAGDTLHYATFLGGSSADYGSGITLDSSYHAYLTGETNSANFPTTPTAFDTSYNANSDAFAAKLSPLGDDLEYATFLGGIDSDIGWDIALDADRSAYLTGETYSANFPTTSEAYDTTQNGDSDAFMVKLNPSGNDLEYATYLGGGSSDIGYGIAVLAVGNVLLTGSSSSANFPITTGAFDSTFDNGDAFVTKFGVADTTAPEAIDDLSITLEGGPKRKGGDIRLWWSPPYDDKGVSRYVVYRSSAASALGDSLAGTTDTTYADVGAAGDVDTNYCYVVKAVDAGGNTSGESNKVGEYDYDLNTTPGTDYTWIALCLGHIGLDSASHLEAHIEANSSPPTDCYTISKWNAIGQSYTDYITIPFPLNNYPVSTGQGYRVEVSDSTVWTLTGDVLPVDSIGFSLMATPATDYTWISIPMHLDSLEMASDLEAHIEANSSPPTDCYTVSKWNAIGQSYTDYITIPFPLNDYPIFAGQAYRVEVSDSTAWPSTPKGLNRIQPKLQRRR